MKNTNRPIVILFDGVCNLCNGAVQFIIERDRLARFRFASLQSAYAKKELTRLGLRETSLHSMLVIDGDTVYDRSDAVLFIVRHLSGLWPALRFLKILPAFLRNGFYNFVARHRYRVFGKRDTCMIPTPARKSRFLDL